MDGPLPKIIFQWIYSKIYFFSRGYREHAVSLSYLITFNGVVFRNMDNLVECGGSRNSNHNKWLLYKPSSKFWVLGKYSTGPRGLFFLEENVDFL